MPLTTQHLLSTSRTVLSTKYVTNTFSSMLIIMEKLKSKMRAFTEVVKKACKVLLNRQPEISDLTHPTY